MCVCNNSLKPYRGEISGRRYGVGHYRSSTCITSFLPLVSHGCRGAQQEGCCLNSISVHPCVYVCFFLLSLFRSFAGRPCGPTASVSAPCCFFFPLSLLAAVVVFLRFSLQGLLARTLAHVRAGTLALVPAIGGAGCVCVCAHACRMTFSETWQRQEETSDS